MQAVVWLSDLVLVLALLCQSISVFSKSAHAIAAKEIVLSKDSYLVVSNKRPSEERFLQDLFSPGKLTTVYHSTWHMAACPWEQ